MGNLKKRINSNGLGRTVVAFRAGFDESRSVPKCLTFFRTRQIAIRVADARESELCHIRGCNECAARLRAFQRDLGTSPHDAVHDHLRDLVHGIEEPVDGEHHIIEMAELLGRNLFTAFKAPLAEADEKAGYSWNRTHDLLHMLRYVKKHGGSHVPVLFAGCAVALSHAAATHAIESSSIDDASALAESLEEGIGAVRGSAPLVHEYSKLFSHVAIEAPPVVRHTLLWSLWNLFDHGHEARHSASAALDRIVNSRHAPEVTTTAALIWQLHSHGRPQGHCESPELPRMLHRIDKTKEILVSLLTSGRSHDVLYDRLNGLLAHTFDDRSARSQILSLIVTRTALHDALHIAAARSVPSELIQDFISLLLFRHAEHAPRPLLIDMELAAVASDAFPAAYTNALLDFVRPSGRSSLRAHPYERHVFVMSAVKVYNRRLMAGAIPPRFEHDQGRWTFSGAGKKGIDHLFHELAVIATSDPSYGFHLEWANARFAIAHYKHGKNKRAVRSRSKSTCRHLHSLVDSCV
jgi:hypothetical protein